MSTPLPTTDVVPLAMSGCDACGLPIRGGWAFCPDDLFCPLCGLRVYHLEFAEQVPAADGREEVWVYLPSDGLAALHVRARRGTTADRSVKLPTNLNWPSCSARFNVSRFGVVEFSLTPDTTPPTAEGMKTYTRVTLTPNSRVVLPSSVIGPMGVPGELILIGTAGLEIRPARLLPMPTRWIRLAQPGKDDLSFPVIGYQDETGLARVELDLWTEDARVFIRRFGVPPADRSPEFTHTALSDSSEVKNRMVIEPGRRLRLRFQVSARPNPQPEQSLPTLWWFAGMPEPYPIDLLLTLRRAPRLAFHPESRREELRLGESRAVMVSLAAIRTGDEPPRIVTAEVVRENGDPAWVEFDRRPPLPLTVPFDRDVSLFVSVRTGLLNRLGYDGKELTSALKLTDQTGRIWEYPIRAVFARMAKLPVPLALDWGTTNTCGAWSDGGDRPISVAFGDDVGNADLRRRFETFPSDVYIEDVSEPTAPSFQIGHQARFQANADKRTESLVVSLKRQFLRGGTVYVMDRRGRSHTYPVEELTRFVIRRLLLMAELGMGKEVNKFGVTFPTKWPAGTRRRFARMLEAVRTDLSTLHGHLIAVQLLPPRIDEANAVALNLLDELARRDGFAERTQFVLAAYDFGGGTVDTSLLRVTVDPDADPLIRTDYLGIGGRGDFGGDDVTRAVLMLLRERAQSLLVVAGEGSQPETKYQIPLLPSGQAPPVDVPDPSRWYRDGRRNWEVLWRVAEQVKMALCDPGWQTAAETATTEPVRFYLSQQLTDVTCHPVSRTEAPIIDLNQVLTRTPTGGVDLSGGGDPFDRFFTAVRFGLNEVYGFALDATDGGPTPLTVRDRIEDLAKELRAQCDAANVGTPNYVVLAGGGCGLPLVQESLTRHLGLSAENLVYQSDYAKQRVAHGKAWYAFNQTVMDIDRGLARSVDVLHRPLAVSNRPLAKDRYVVVAPIGALVDAPTTWHGFPLGTHLVKRGDGPRRVVLLTLAWRNGELRASDLGYFDLEHPTESLAADPPSQTVPLPEELGGSVRGELRLARESQTDSEPGPVRIHLCVTLAAGTRYGPFPLIPKQSEPDRFEDELQGPGSG